MNSPLKNQIKVQIAELNETPFQDFVTELLLKYYGENGFITIRGKKDEGCDGVIVGDKEVIACYGPVKYDKKAFNKKAEDDFDSYQKNWETTYPNWKMIVNHDPSPDEIKKVQQLKNGSNIWGIKNLLSIIEDKLCSKKRRDIAKYLGVDKNIIAQDYIREILEDLLSAPQSGNYFKYDTPLYLSDKVELNFKSDEIENFNDQYSTFAADGVLSDIKNIMSSYGDGEINKIKIRIREDLDLINGKLSFKDKIDTLATNYKLKYSDENDDDYRFYIKAIIVYCFEQCIIGKKTKQEK